MNMRVYFPEGKKVFAEYNGFVHQTDQPVISGGNGTAPAPFELFLASIGTCAGIYVLGFCQKRGIDTKNIEINQAMRFNPQTYMIEQIDIDIQLPPDFPEKYRNAVISAVQQCAVKKHMESPPVFNIKTS
jgi:ribosomal protein S12 methylthiotransferase accessory factor